jgi:hypothetical protein
LWRITAVVKMMVGHTMRVIATAAEADSTVASIGKIVAFILGFVSRARMGPKDNGTGCVGSIPISDGNLSPAAKSPE